MKKYVYTSMAALTAVSSIAMAGATVANADEVKASQEKTYEVPVKLMNAHEEKLSMGNGALVGKAKVVVDGDKSEVYLTFKGLSFMKMFGHVEAMQVYKNGLGTDLSPVEVVKTFKDTDLTGAKRDFPEVFKITRDSSKESTLWIKVAVDAMSSIASGGGNPYTPENRTKGEQDARIVLDYANAKELKSPETKAPETKAPETKVPETNQVQAQDVKNRIAGSNRYITSVKISEKFFKSANTVVLANGRNYADALAAAPLAGVEKAPILLTEASSISNDTLNEISRLKAKNVVIVGGENSVSKNVASQLSSKGLKVERIAGSNRYQTSLVIAQKVREKSSNKSGAILVSGQSFADALSVSALATEKNMPIVLTDAKVIPAQTQKELNSWKLKDLTVVGGLNSVSDAVIKGVDASAKERIAGNNRYQTSVKVAMKAYPKATSLLVANGENAADALSAGAVTSVAKSPLVLVSKNAADASLKEFIKANSIKSGYIIGGVNSVSNALALSLLK